MDGELKQQERQVWNGQEVDAGTVFADKEAHHSGMEQYIDHNFKFWDVCERGGHDFIERESLPPQCAVCGTVYSQEYKDKFLEYGGKHLYGGPGWRIPSVKRSRKALSRLSDSPIGESTVTPQGQSSEAQNESFRKWCKAEEGPNISVVLLFHLFWPVFKLCPHSHSWRPLTSKNDYGRSGSSHWGNYGGRKEEECLLCGVVRARSQP